MKQNILFLFYSEVQEKTLKDLLFPLRHKNRKHRKKNETDERVSQQAKQKNLEQATNSVKKLVFLFKLVSCRAAGTFSLPVDSQRI